MYIKTDNHIQNRYRAVDFLPSIKGKGFLPKTVKPDHKNVNVITSDKY